MNVFYTIRSLAGRIDSLRSLLIRLAEDVQEVYILGRYLYIFLLNVSAYLGVLSAILYDLAEDFIKFRAEIMSQIGTNTELLKIINYVDDIISIVRDPAWFIKSGIKQFMPVLYDLNTNAGQKIINILLTSTGLTYSFLSSPSAFITGLISSTLGDLIHLRNNPRDWIIDKLAQYTPELRQFIQSPSTWIKNEVLKVFPDLSAFIRSPEDFITEKVVNGFERLFNQYGIRLAKIAENIINKIF